MVSQSDRNLRYVEVQVQINLHLVAYGIVVWVIGHVRPYFCHISIKANAIAVLYLTPAFFMLSLLKWGGTTFKHCQWDQTCKKVTVTFFYTRVFNCMSKCVRKGV
jgi:hypothetical protein